MTLLRHSAQLPQFDTLIRQLAESRKKPSPAQAVSNSFDASPDGVLPSCRDCSGNLYIGMFFDGTGNNKEADYGPENNPKPFLERHHSNVVRLFHAFPDENDKIQKKKDKGDTNQFYSYYIPGVGTPFPEIKDKGEGAMGTAGAAAGFGGEARILWAMIQVLNAVHRFYRNKDIFSGAETLGLLDSLLNGKNIAEEDFFKRKWLRIYNMLATDDGTRVRIFKQLIECLKSAISEWKKPKLMNIYIYSFGFSRGAAKARAFTNWMMEICRTKDKNGKNVLKLGDFLIHFPFMGIFDTVASVGAASLWSLFEGHAAWGNETQEIPPEVMFCIHMVAAHEIRACFPLDSVRVKGLYPSNTLEIIYPGAHSDVGGGYILSSYGKADLGDCNKPGREGSGKNGADLQIARVPGFDMYMRAKGGFVPFYSMEQLEAHDLPEFAEDLRPGLPTIIEMAEYMKKTRIMAGPVEEQLQKHTGLYLHWRWHEGVHYTEGDECSRLGVMAQGDLNPQIAETKKELEEVEAEIKSIVRVQNPSIYYGLSNRKNLEKLGVRKKDLEIRLNDLQKRNNPLTANASEQAEFLILTQKSLLQVVAAYCDEISNRTLRFLGGSSWENKPLENTMSIDYMAKEFIKDQVKDAVVKKGAAKLISKEGAKLLDYTRKAYEVSEAWMDSKKEELKKDDNLLKARWAPDKLNLWRDIMRRNAGAAEIHDTRAPEREAMLLLDALAEWEKFHKLNQREYYNSVFGKFFADHVHDSMAGFAAQKVNEFLFNGYGIAKFRRIFFGNTADEITCELAEEGNISRQQEMEKWLARKKTA
jgi:hypothetical protein